MPSSIDIIKTIWNNAKLLKAQAFSESDTIGYLIDPVLNHFGYPITHQRREDQKKGNRPDIVIWKYAEDMIYGKPATAVIEAKSLGTDLSGNGKAKQERPKEQIARYITGYEHASTNTLGVLTDGNIWHIVTRTGTRTQTKLVSELKILEGTLAEAAESLDKIGRIFQENSTNSTHIKTYTTKARAIVNGIADGDDPVKTLERLSGTGEKYINLGEQVSLQGKQAQAELNYWESYAYTRTGRIKIDQNDLNHEAICVAVVRMSKANSKNDAAIYREDVATAASGFAKTVPVRMSIVLVIQPDENGNPVNMRVAVHHQGHTSMTAEFDPYTPSPFVLHSIQDIYDQLRKKDPILSKNIADIVTARGVRKEFYVSVADWVLRQYRKTESTIKDNRQYREFVLRHLIRTLFVWILKEEGKLPQEAFDQVFAHNYAPDNYHEQILTFMFHERLNKPKNMRRIHPVAQIQSALYDTRFLNGSLFAIHEYDKEFQLNDADYFGSDPNTPGLFTILSEYDWTVSEHTPSHSDQTIDPEVLGNLFENLITVSETDDTPDKMPKGTYYTPADVAKEMTKDALMLATRDYAPLTWKESDLFSLFSDSNSPLPADITEQQKNRLANRIKKLTIFDPTVGSGAFPLSAVYAIRIALEKLDPLYHIEHITRRIVSQQIYAQDINAMAVQITRLRLFIAIIAAEKNVSDPLPLPNLEAKIVCADTLNTVPNRGWSPTSTGGLQDSDVNIVRSLKERAAIFERWQEAHKESDKYVLRSEDEVARDRLKRVTSAGISGNETRAFADHKLLEPGAPPAKTDPRLLFYREDWAGFDIVIGNPPYEIIARGHSKSHKKHICAELRNRGYRTVPCNDLYALVAEAGLTLTNPENGVLTLIVPLNICFRHNTQILRELIKHNSKEIRLRNHDQRPDPIFKESPVAHPENRQRTTILNVVTTSVKPNNPNIFVTGTNKWLKNQRREFLEYRQWVQLPQHTTSMHFRLDHQWDRIPTIEVADLISRMRDSRIKIIDLDSAAKAQCQSTVPKHSAKAQCQSTVPKHSAKIGFPNTAYNFIAAAPHGKLDRIESVLSVGNADDLAIAMAAANSHAAYTWWKVYGDAFNVNSYIMGTIAIPNQWIKNEKTRNIVISLGEKLIESIKPENVVKQISGINKTKRESINFYECNPQTIAEIDKLYLDALGLPIEPLLAQLRILRSNSTWRV